MTADRAAIRARLEAATQGPWTAAIRRLLTIQEEVTA